MSHVPYIFICKMWALCNKTNKHAINLIENIKKISKLRQYKKYLQTRYVIIAAFPQLEVKCGRSLFYTAVSQASGGSKNKILNSILNDILIIE